MFLIVSFGIVWYFQAKALGKVLFDQVCRQLNLLEADYFGLEYQEHSSNVKVTRFMWKFKQLDSGLINLFLSKQQYWLDLEKPINRQVGLSLVEPILKFCVKFYTPDPVQLEEEFTR